MATFTIDLKAGNNLISVPLNLSTATDDPKVLFNPTLLNTDGTQYLYRHIIANGLALFNDDGSWSGNYNKIHPQDGFWVYTFSDHSVEFTGDNINPTTLQYKLKSGNNLVSYPYQVDNKFGGGKYTAPSTPYTIRTDFLKGSGHADEAIIRVFGQDGGRFYKSIDSPTYDANNPENNWAGNLTKFEAGKGYWVYSDRAVDLDARTLFNPTQSAQDYPQFPNMRPSATDYNYSLNFPALNNETVLTAKWTMFLGKILTHDSVTVYDATGSYSNYQSVISSNSAGTDFSASDSETYALGFFVDELYGANADYPMYGCRGGFIPPSTVSGVFDDQPVLTSGSEESFIELSNTDFNEYLINPSFDIDINLKSHNAQPFGNLANPNNDDNAFISDGNDNNTGYKIPSIYLAPNSTTQYAEFSEFFPDGTNLLTQNPQNYYGFNQGFGIVPILYDGRNSAKATVAVADGSGATVTYRHRFLAYYPHYDDAYYIRNVDGSTGYTKRYYRNHPDYINLFFSETEEVFDENIGDFVQRGVAGTEKYSSVYNAPYFDTSGEVEMPYRIMQQQGYVGISHVWKGIFKAMDFPS